MGSGESTHEQPTGTYNFGVEMSGGHVREVAITNFVKTRATFTWNMRQLRNLPKGNFEASSPPFVHPSASRWRMHLSKGSCETFQLGFILFSSEKGLPVRASIKTRVEFKYGRTLELSAIESELFNVGEMKGNRTLIQPKNMESGTLQVESEVTVVCSVMESAPGTTNSLQADLATLLKTGEDADVTIRAGPGSYPFKAHSTLLCARSRIFAAMMQSPEVITKSGYVFNMEKVEPHVVKELLRYIYTDQTPSLSREMAEELLALANRYELMGLMRRCELKLCERLTVENAASTALLGVTHSCLTLLQVVVPFIEQRYLEVMCTPGWAVAIHTDHVAMVTLSRLLSDAAHGEFKIRL